MSQPKLKIYTHPQHYLEVGGRKKRLKRFFKVVGKILTAPFYYSGAVVIYVVSGFLKLCFFIARSIFFTPIKLFKAIKREFLKTAKLLPQRLKQVKRVQFKSDLGLFITSACLVCVILAGFHLAAQGIELKNSVLKTASWGNNYLAQAKSDLSAQDFSLAQSRFTLAYNTFEQAHSKLQNSGVALNQILNLLPQKKDADLALKAASLISQAGQNFVTLESQIKSLTFNAQGIQSSTGQNSQTLQSIADLLSQTQNQIDSAANDLNQINISSFPGQNRESFVELNSQLSNLKLAVDNFNQIYSLFYSLVKGNKTLLLLFENNNELRAGGGFIGTYGDFEISDGAIGKMTVSSIYDLDGQLTQAIKPPEPILNLSDKWYLRDSNWFADFPSSAQKISNFYELEAGKTPDVVMVVTPNLIIDWLKITGPIKLPKYGVILTADNFIEETQVQSTLSNNLPTNQPKQILADLVPILVQKLSTMGKDQLAQFVQSLQNNLNNKQIVIYSRDQNTEQQLQQLQWAGSLDPTDRDFISVVSSNLGGTKTDLSMDQAVNINTAIAGDGSVTDEVEITRTNKMPDLPDTQNTSFIRIYVPQGSQLISNLGFEDKKIDYPSGENYKIDTDVYNWEKNSVTDNLSGTIIGQETGKTFFGNWLTVKGGESKTVKLTYKLPFKMSNIDHYSLLIQKQIGSLNQSFNWAFSFPGYQISWKNFDTENLNTSSLSSDIILDKDYFLGLVLEKRN